MHILIHVYTYLAIYMCIFVHHHKRAQQLAECTSDLWVFTPRLEDVTLKMSIKHLEISDK